ncbi:hypothetical protein [Pseudaminobacter sp. NGMCC 1.201702]|uniref:hypothetical protein n=1 Tax=Pseudaminobacter sp. NGMCC 1.201702 TaxID=3391825 RepID=UPI0039F04F9A
MHLIFDVENHIDPIVCRTEAEVRDMVVELGDAPFQVLRIDVDELCRDVTDEFLPDEGDDSDDACGIPSPDSLRRWHNSRVL